ncbi:MAG: helix-turn-helix domain-containing protein [Clostridia bacterium]|nr:helix-turn-helix domain-containing protein [Clostridia bacterium]
MELKLGTIIKKLRTERGITQEELANKIGVSYQAVSKWETNTTTPDIAILPQLALFFGVSMDALFSMDQDDYIERISKMIRDEYSITPENFVWAERYLKGLLSEEKQNNIARTLLVELYEHRENRDSLAGGRLCEEGLLIEPSNIALIGKLTRIREKRNEADRLIKFLETLYSKNTQNVVVIDALISAYIKYGKYADAENLMNSSKKRAIFNVYEGDIALAFGHHEKAKDIWLSAASSNYNDSHLLFEIAERFNKINDAETALKLYQQSYDVAPSPKEMDALYAQAFLYTNIGMKDKAIQMWQSIIKALADDYDIKNGECVDWANREIQNLRQ